jgi:hypothetical protein
MLKVLHIGLTVDEIRGDLTEAGRSDNSFFFLEFRYLEAIHRDALIDLFKDNIERQRERHTHTHTKHRDSYYHTS